MVFSDSASLLTKGDFLQIPTEGPENQSDLSTSQTPTPYHLSGSLRWEGNIEIQSGDILLVKIDDSELIAQNAKGAGVGRPDR